MGDDTLTDATVAAPSSVEASLDRILWACDFSEGAADALRFVLPIARAYGSAITALHVLPAAIGPGSSAPAFTNPALLRSHLHHDLAARLERAAGPAVQSHLAAVIALREGRPAGQIVDMASRLPADLLVVGTHGSRALGRYVFGSVAEEVIGSVRCPVLAVPALPETAALRPIATVLLATDFSAHAVLAGRRARALAAKLHARLLAVHVVEGPSLLSDRERLAEAQARLRDEAPGGESEGIATLGSASGEILRVSRERHADLVVMGVQGSRSLHTLLVGSTTHRVIRESPCPVLAVRQV
jgi:nucleotide-binding universal stress UspA family protein